MIIDYNGKPFEYAERPKYVPLLVNTTEPIIINHGCIHEPTFAYLVRTDAETVMTLQCVDRTQAVVTFSHSPANVVICFE
jgi:hypothetical protein